MLKKLSFVGLVNLAASVIIRTVATCQNCSGQKHDILIIAPVAILLRSILPKLPPIIRMACYWDYSCSARNTLNPKP